MPHENIFLVDVDNTISCQFGITGKNNSTEYEQIFNEELIQILQRLSLDERNKIYLFTAFCAYQSGELVSFGGKAHQGFKSEIYSVLTKKDIKLHGLITKGSPYFDHSHEHPLGTFGEELMQTEKTMAAELNSKNPNYKKTLASPFLIPGEKERTINLPNIHMPKRLSAFLRGIPDAPEKPHIPAEPTLHSIATQEINMIMRAIEEKMHGPYEDHESSTQPVTGAPPNHKEEMLKHLLAKLGLITLSAGSKFTIDSISAVPCTTSTLANDTATSSSDVNTFSIIVIDDDERLHKTVGDLQNELRTKLPARSSLPFTLHLIPILAPIQCGDANPYFPSSLYALQSELHKVGVGVPQSERPYIPPIFFTPMSLTTWSETHYDNPFSIKTASESPLTTPQDSGITEESDNSSTSDVKSTLPRNKLL